MRRLKDKDLQKQLDELSGGSFSDGLAKGVIKLHDDSGIPLMKVEFGPVVGKSMTRRFALVFEEGDIEDAPDYNPKTWNRYPDVTPPVGVWTKPLPRSMKKRSYMTKVEWHPIRAVETEDGTIKWEGNTPAPYETVLITTSDGEVEIDTFIKDFEGDSFITVVDDVIAWAELPEPYKKPKPLDMHPDAIAARRYMENHHDMA